MTKLFGTSGIRGPASTLFTPQFCFDIGQVFSLFLKNHHQAGEVSIGLDSRASSPTIVKYLSAGLLQGGFGTSNLGTLSVPATHYSCITGGFIASIMVTGSHIDATSNGVKFFAFKEEITKEHEAKIESLYEQLKGETIAPNSFELPTISNLGFSNYLDLLLSLTDFPLPKIKIVFDPGNGGQTEIISAYLRETGLEVIPINNHIQEQLISRDTESDGSFVSLQEAVKLHQADLGVGFDSDGDRVVFVDKNGNFIPGDYSGTLLSKWYADDTVVTPINTSNVINFIHKEVVRTKVGSPYVIAGMKKNASVFGFEGNGGGIHADIMYSRDGGTSFVRMLNILKWSGKSLNELISDFPRFNLLRTKFSCPFDKYPLILEKAPQFFTANKVDRTDGVKLILDDTTWVLFRGSGNAPEFRVFVESNSQTKAKQLLDDAVRLSQKIINV